jgi:hypothetical protein
MTRKFCFVAATIFAVASAPALAATGFATLPSLPDPFWSAHYTIPDTEIDMMLADHPERAPGGHMVLAPNQVGGAPGATLDIPLRLLAIPLE